MKQIIKYVKISEAILWQSVSELNIYIMEFADNDNVIMAVV